MMVFIRSTSIWCTVQQVGADAQYRGVFRVCSSRRLILFEEALHGQKPESARKCAGLFAEGCVEKLKMAAGDVVSEISFLRASYAFMQVLLLQTYR